MVEINVQIKKRQYEQHDKRDMVPVPDVRRKHRRRGNNVRRDAYLSRSLYHRHQHAGDQCLRHPKTSPALLPTQPVTVESLHLRVFWRYISDKF